jgi:hypothetical protein
MWPYIALGIAAFIAAAVFIILLLPVCIIIKSDDEGNLILRYKFLNKIYGEAPAPDNAVTGALKKATGIDRLRKEKLKSGIERGDIKDTIESSLEIILDLLKELISILKYCRISKLEVDAVISGEDAADAAINFGKCCAVVYPAIGGICSLIPEKRNAKNINITCDYCNDKPEHFSYEIIIRVRVCRVAAALLRIIFKEAKRRAE